MRAPGGLTLRFARCRPAVRPAAEESSLSAACAACGARDYRRALRVPDWLADKPAVYDLDECAGCGLLSTEIPEATERYPADYYARFPADPSSGNRTARRLAVLEQFRAGGRVLDVGCGAGEFLRALESASWTGCGTEVNRIAVDRLRQRGQCVREGSLAEQVFPRDGFDAATYVGTFEHVPAPREELREVRRIVRPGGGLILNVTDAGSAEARLFRTAWFGYEAPRHCYNYTRESLGRLLRSEGFAVVGMEAQQSLFITEYSLVCALGLRSWYGRIAPALHRVLVPYRAVLGRCGSGNLLEVTARRIG